MEENQVATDEVLALDSPEIEFEQPVVEKSMDDTIRDTLKELREKSEAPLDDLEKAQKIRDDKGNFSAKEAVTDTNAPATIPTDKPAPNTWKKEAQAEWIKLPANVREEVERREADFHKGIEQYKTKAQYGDSMERAIAPYMATINSFNVSPDIAVNELLKSDHTLRHGNVGEKLAMVGKIFRDYGINPQEAFNYFQNGAPPADPRDLRIENLERANQQQQNMAEQRDTDSLNSEITKFSSDPLHNHFETVKGQMAALLQAGQAKDLSDAYEQAIYANPTTRSLVLAEQQTKSKAEATQKAQAAKNASSVNTRNRPSMPVSQPIGTMDDTIRSTLRRLQAS